MGRERDKKSAVMVIQQQWQAKGGYATAGAYSPLVGKREECHTTTLAEGNSSSSSSVSAMRDPLLRTKVVVRRLPPTLTKEALVSRIDAKFSGTYLWLVFRPGKPTHRSQVHSRAYIEFRRPEDLVAFHEDFDGHVFVNEKGSQFKAMVEYAPYQRVPDLRSKKDGREGSISKDPDYLEFVEALGKPADLLPSADVQFVGPGASKDGIIVTPLMEYVRQKRAAKSAQRSAKAGFRSASIMGPPPTGFVIQKRGDKGKAVSSAENGKDAPVYVRREHKKRASEFKEKKQSREAGDEANSNGYVKESDTLSGDGQCADSKSMEADGQKIGRKPAKDREKSESGYASRGRPPVSPAQSPSAYKHSNYRARASSPISGKFKPHTTRHSGSETDPTVNGNAVLDGRRLRNKDRPDRPVWTPRRRLDTFDSEADAAGVARSRVGHQDANEAENEVDGRNGALENGTYRTGVRKGSPRDSDHLTDVGKHLKRGGPLSFGANEKQVWVAVQRTG